MKALNNVKLIWMVGLGLIAILMCVWVAGCSDSIIGPDSQKSQQEVPRIEREPDYTITGANISPEDLEHFYALLELSQGSERNTSALIHEMLRERLESKLASNNTRGSDNYTKALEFAVDHWYLTEEGHRTEESLLLITALVFDEQMEVEEASDLANSDVQVLAGIPNYPAVPDALYVHIEIEGETKPKKK